MGRQLVGGTLAAFLVVAMFAVPAGAVPAPPGPSASQTLADWEMNEGSGAHVMKDSSGHVNGSIGSAVKTGVTAMGATGYEWPFASPTQPPPKPQRIVQANSSNLNPGSGTYIVVLRYRTTEHFGNIVQKGQAGSSGGYFKLENPDGRLNCEFRGVNGHGQFKRKDVESPQVLSNGAWHVARCERTSNALTLSIDGKVVDTASGSSGSISNTRPVTIGGKLSCDQKTVTCDYFTGGIDYIKLER